MTDMTENRKKASIVIVDDEESILKELRILLGRTYDIHIFINPEEAEAFVDENQVNMVISDEMMPEMRGSELLARIHQKHPDICNIVLSGQAEKDDIVRAVNEGHIFSFLYKPAERQQLINVIEKGLENQHMKRVLAEQNVQLKEYSENLERMVNEKTAELVQAYDRLNSLDANKMYFLVYLSQEMDSSLDRIQQLAEVLLTYFAFAGAEIKADCKTANLKDMVDEVIQDAMETAEQKGLDLKIELEAGTTVYTDQAYLTQVLRILVDNALIFTPSGGSVTVTERSANGQVQLCIVDTGQGIAEENLRDIFKPFLIDRSLRHPDGFGLNLPQARTIMHALDGKIWAESGGPGKGATFCVELRAG